MQGYKVPSLHFFLLMFYVNGASKGESVIALFVIRHFLERENGNRKKKLRYCVNNQYGIQRDWVNLA